MKETITIRHKPNNIFVPVMLDEFPHDFFEKVEKFYVENPEWLVFDFRDRKWKGIPCNPAEAYYGEKINEKKGGKND